MGGTYNSKQSQLLKAGHSYLTITAIKYIQRAVIMVVSHILYIIFHLQLNRVAFIIFATFHFLISVLFGQPLKRNKDFYAGRSLDFQGVHIHS